MPRARAKLLLRLLFGETQAKTKILIEEVCLGKGEENLGRDAFEEFCTRTVTAKEAAEVGAEVFEHLGLLRGARAKTFVEVFMQSMHRMDKTNPFLLHPVDPHNLPHLDIAQEELHKFSMEKMFRTLLRVLFVNQLLSLNN